VKLGEFGGVGVEEADGGEAEVGGEVAGLIEEFFGEVEGSEVAVSEVPEAEGGASGAATGFEERRGFVGEEAFDQDALGFPEAEEVRGARVVDDGDGVVEVGANGGGGDFGGHCGMLALLFLFRKMEK
jgi:hypothetical protein